MAMATKNLLIITQKVDANDDILGFFHGWLREFAKHWEKITVICLFAGGSDLPANVKVLSLGKEKNNDGRRSSTVWQRIIYLFRFYRFLWQERKNYDAVFAHMNIEYVLLAGWLWRLLRKKVFLWYNHQTCRWPWYWGARWAEKVFYTSPFSFFSKYPSGRIMPAGIDADLFQPDSFVCPAKNSILYLGRISPIKNIEILIDAAKVLKAQGQEFKMSIVGSPSAGHENYYEQLKELVDKSNLSEAISFFPGRPIKDLPAIYRQHQIFVNLTNSGSLDKTTLEALACGCLALVSNRSFEQIFPDEYHEYRLFRPGDAVDLAAKLQTLWSISPELLNEIKNEAREIAVRGHGLKVLAKRLKEEMP
ncbi:hypothetical protein COX22_00005 [Candidatus Falkowbacteria bacterium CG23_combo_of_CG06-09_8_20_14_all_49_15]|uniref:Glycosyl transferase family 1 domain-containing protein n=1 Tax=Candidatus Falkowbacteria bacterium CG23_combo_of_CG06-09_8_20_14_all_49_15 TaxID=1974572 RepID=A0A2G9ZNT5_9BACT|nr:MAG: hypothetical protein COX22_00005 [Candidatus Falkowbacteria bacterium CG23_combo_of_CG06-09_8_20_14_all_49_15]